MIIMRTMVENTIIIGLRSTMIENDENQAPLCGEAHSVDAAEVLLWGQ